MFRRVSLKYFTILASIILSVMMFMGYLCSTVLANQSIDRTIKNLETAAGNVASLCSTLPKNSIIIGRGALEETLDVIKNTQKAEVMVVSYAGTVEVTTLDSDATRFSKLSSNEDALQQVLDGKVYRSRDVFLRQHSKLTPSYTVGYPIMRGDNLIAGAVFVTTTEIGLWDTLAPFLMVYLLFIGIALMLAFIIIYFVTLRMFKPLTQMSQAVKKYAEGDFTMRVQVRHDDEFGELATAFNNMADSLGQLETMRQSFVEDVSHELRTPMTTIGGFIDGILDGVIEPKQQKKYLMIISDEIKRLSRMVSSMLDVARIQSGTMVYSKTNFDLSTLLKKNVDSFEERMRDKCVTLHYDLDADADYYVYADKDSIYRVIFNLMDNAVKFVNENGDIRIKMECRDDKIYVAIRNSGDGIPQREVGQIFERFYKRDKSRSQNKNGVGIGLFLVKTIIKEQGGDIFVSSKEKEFAEFSFTLPVAKDF